MTATAVVTTPFDLPELAPISLEELVDAAALQTRIDRKYVLPRPAAAVLLAGLDRETRVLEIDGARAMHYESVYFDTPDLLSYHLAARGRRRRFKLRTRAYLATEVAYVELKTRGARGTTVKERIAHPFADRHRLTTTAREYVDDGLAGLGLESLELRPTITTRYARTTFTSPRSGGRATVDDRLVWATPDGRRLDLPELAIIETKSGAGASEIDRLLWAHGHRPQSISKFGTGMAALDPTLPSTKWRRVLRRHVSA